eukprot:CAMPEP_0116893702 /NCGR_PEP_ID=MMETSP0467-20121206/3637_1 /TAXON_ID=283647 /ORGANISM="Mesodinium pulex, Strain SPMC105" /LENGTH=118 /DNA_ID=CAMNT_0004563519 /DNA_START=101 /DNA_END=458 /DNA_ORIENTATION=+
MLVKKYIADAEPIPIEGRLHRGRVGVRLAVQRDLPVALVYYDSSDPHIALSKNQLLLFGKELDLIMRTQKLYSKRQMLSALASIKDALKTPSTSDDPIENKKDGDTADTTTSDSDTEQ